MHVRRESDYQVGSGPDDRVTPGTTLAEHNESALPQTADLRADAARGLRRANTVEKVENTAKTKFSQKLAGGGFLLRMRSSCEEEGRRKASVQIDVVHRV